MDINDIKKVLKYVKDNKFDSIYENYGNIPYAVLTPQWYKDADIEILLEEKDYRRLYEKYGSNIFDQYMERRKSNRILKRLHVSRKFLDILSIINSFKKICLIACSLGQTLAASYFVFALSMVAIGVAYLIDTDVNAKTYEREIEQYNLEIEEYANYINSLELTDLEVIKKYMYDMHSNIEYKVSQDYNLIDGYERLSLYCDSCGVCRDMADDFKARMNAINPEYDVHTIRVYMESADDNYFKYLSSEEAYQSFNRFLGLSRYYFLMKLIGNHAVSCLRLEDGTILVVDVTNSWIGVLEDGNIKIFDEYYKQNCEIDIKFLGNILYLEAFDEYIKSMLDSYSLDVDSNLLEEQYGDDAQDVAYQYIKEYDTEHYGTYGD